MAALSLANQLSGRRPDAESSLDRIRRVEVVDGGLDRHEPDLHEPARGVVHNLTFDDMSIASDYASQPAAASSLHDTYGFVLANGGSAVAIDRQRCPPESA
jgi:hypothetical protein